MDFWDENSSLNKRPRKSRRIVSGAVPPLGRGLALAQLFHPVSMVRGGNTVPTSRLYCQASLSDVCTTLQNHLVKDELPV